MEKNHISSKVFPILVILFINNISLISTINFEIVEASDDNELIEVITHVFDLKGDNRYTIQLTKKQLRDVQRIFDEMNHRLSTAKSMDETHGIFYDTIILMKRYNLLPPDMSIQQAKRLAISQSQNQKIMPIFQKIFVQFQTDPKEGIVQNYFCLIAGNTSNTHFAKPFTKMTMRLFDIMDYSSGNSILVKVTTALWILFNPISILSQKFLRVEGNHYGASIFFGNFHYYPYPNWLSPAQGCIVTNGINGQQNLSGSFWGQKITSGWQPQDDWYMNYTWRGCVGFTGFITYVGSDIAYYLGSALQVNVGSNRPKVLL